MMLCSKSKIVIVDDSPLFRTYLKGLLASQYDLELIEINTAQELHAYLRNANIQDIALVLLDLNLPDGNGIEVVQKMKESPATRDLAVIIVSAYIDKDTALLAIKTGAQDLVVKPFKAEELLESIDKLFSSEPLVQQIYLRDQKEVKDYYQQINTEIKRARRANYQLTLLMTGFFRNGSLDPPTRGDDCRQNIALGSAFLQLLRESLRETDSVFSLSTHEYLLILPFTSAQGTVTVLENMEQSFAKTLQHKGCVAMKMLTAMVSYPSDGGDFREIIAKLEARYKEQL